MHSNLQFGAVAGFVISIIVGTTVGVDTLAAISIGIAAAAFVSAGTWMAQARGA